jgi:peptide-methionine (S)-S-oxide reductase
MQEKATLGGGCFWCLEAVFLELKGVAGVQSGYAGGAAENPTYKQVCSGTTGHAEVVQVTFAPSVVSFEDLLRIFFTIHDPTTKDRQGADVGTQYRSAIFYESEAQRRSAEKIMKEIAEERLYPGPIVTQIAPLDRFWPAEDYHADYFNRNPEQGYCRIVIEPKVAKFRNKWREKLKGGV